jgi:cyclopropane fatty-acyl-phospholipid synthase-like methyltransferase
MNKLEKYERMAADFEQNHQLNGYHHFRRLEIVLSFLRKLGKDLIILDAGCGDGLQLDKYVKSYMAFGVDISR